MATINGFLSEDIRATNQHFSSFKAIIETAFYGTNVQEIESVAAAYHLAKQCSGTIVTDLPILHPELLGLPTESNLLIFNDGEVTGRTAAARVVVKEPDVDHIKYEKVLREALFTSRLKKFYKSSVYVGLHPEFMVKSHLMIPEGYENSLYSYLLNFQFENKEWAELYEQSIAYNETDLFIYADPDWTHPDFPHGLAFFDVEHNVAAILGLRYFGELKKATLTLAWASATRNGFISCHGGVKQYLFDTGDTYTMAAFGLSGSGKSTITLANHGEKQKVTVLHDDAFVINKRTGSTTALEPAYFDKTQDYSLESDATRYFLTLQNVGATLTKEKKVVPVLADIRNSNGRTVKSRFVTPNRVDHCTESLNAIFWIMKDDSLPPLIKIDSPELAAVFGLTLSTKRSTAENLVGKIDKEELVIEPFANPFRAYPLNTDYLAFRELFFSGGTDCYILNTGFFLGKKVTPEVTLTAIETILSQTTNFQPFGPIEQMYYLPIQGFEVDFDNQTYKEYLRERMIRRLEYLETIETEKEGYNKVDESAKIALQTLINRIE